MPKSFFKFFIISLTIFLAAGCATTRARHAAQADQASQTTQLQSELQTKDQQIQELQYQLESYRHSIQGSSESSASAKSSASSIIKVPGISVADVQQALIRAGYDPGSVDGQAGKKTKVAIKAFQRKNNLKADGVVGEKTWARLS